MRKKADLVADIINNIRRVFQVVNEQSKKAESRTGLTGPQLWAIKVMSETGSIRISDLAARMFVHPATVVGIIDRLEARGMAVRVRSSEDRRVVKVDLTEAAHDLVARAPRVAQGLLVAGLEVLTGRELENISTGLDRLVDILGAQKLPPQMMLHQEDDRSGRAGKKGA